MAERQPTIDYQGRRDRHAAAVTALTDRERLAGGSRLGAFAVVVAVLAFVPTQTAAFAIAFTASLLAFFAAIAWHRRIRDRLARGRSGIRYATRRLTRLTDEWIGTGPAGDGYREAAHPYSGDLDIFGRGSLFEFLCEAHTPVGRDTLAAWLLAPASSDVVRDRQEAVTELRGNFDFREALGIVGNFDRPEVKTRELAQWSESPPVLTDRAGSIGAIVLGLLGTVAAIAWAVTEVGPSPLLLVVIVQVIFTFRLWQRIRQVTGQAAAMLAELNAFLPVLQCVETLRPAAPLLRSQIQRLNSGGENPSARVARLTSLLDAWDSATRNQFVLPLAVIVMAPVHLAYAIERWRLRDGRAIRGWLEAVAEVEALVSLATLAYEQEDFAVPELAAEGPVFEAEGLGHPLLPRGRRVTNDVRLGPAPALLLVSGSNMAGKSTLMRAIGVNAVLAQAGAPVCAKRLRLSPVAVATAMRQGDSLQDGVSSFYAEIRRLQAIRELTRGPRPVLFLLDEILRGTNSHDRRVGAEAVIRVLLDRGGIGLVSTHDLTLAEIVDRLGSRAANVHFEDQMADGQVSFDYRLRPGVVPRGNGLVLLKLLGFEVADSPFGR